MDWDLESIYLFLKPQLPLPSPMAGEAPLELINQGLQFMIRKSFQVLTRSNFRKNPHSHFRKQQFSLA